MQTTLETFVYGSENYPRFFIYDWSKKRAYFEFTKPEKSHFVKKVRDPIFGFVNVLLVGKPLNLEKREFEPLKFDWNELDETQKEDKDKIIKNTAILKSSIQKMVRRQKQVLALRSAYTLLYLKPEIFLRRLLVIMLEDVVIHRFFTELCWYMMAVPNYRLDMADFDFLMNMVYTLVDCQYHRSFRIADDKNKMDLGDMVDKMKKEYKKNIVNEIKQKEIIDKMSLILAVYFREKFGGLEGDLKMMENIRNVLFNEWFVLNEEYDKDKKMDFIKIPAIKRIDDRDNNLRELGFQFLKLKEIDICSVDFHTCPEMVNYICQKLGGKDKFPDFRVKQIMWRQSSGINTRRNYKKQVETDKQKEEAYLWEKQIKPNWISWLKMNGPKVCHKAD